MFYRSAGKRSARSNASAASSAPLSRQHTATYRSETSQNIQTTRIPCPIALRQRILGLDQTLCRCSRHYIPQIMDIEYNEFIQIEAPDGQLIVISVVSSLQVALPTFLYWLLWNTFLCKPSTNISLYYGWMSTPIHTKNLNFGTYILQVNKFFFLIWIWLLMFWMTFFLRFPHSSTSDQMIEEIYLSQNRNRTKPCVQSRMDMFRILQYDINTASEGSNHTQPLLLTRHNVVPGMFLVGNWGWF